MTVTRARRGGCRGATYGADCCVGSKQNKADPPGFVNLRRRPCLTRLAASPSFSWKNKFGTRKAMFCEHRRNWSDVRIGPVGPTPSLCITAEVPVPRAAASIESRWAKARPTRLSSRHLYPQCRNGSLCARRSLFGTSDTILCFMGYDPRPPVDPHRACRQLLNGCRFVNIYAAVRGALSHRAY
jgi:hypothetical protein